MSGTQDKYRSGRTKLSTEATTDRGQDDAVNLIHTGLSQFYVDADGATIYLAIVALSGQFLRLTTTAGDTPLLSLPNYPLYYQRDLAAFTPNKRNVFVQRPEDEKSI